MIVIGGGTQHASGEIKALAERLNAPVVANHMGLGVLDSRHPLSFNFLGGVFLWEETDVVIAIGTRLMLQADFGFAGKKIIRIDIDEDQIGKPVAADVAISGDAATVTGALNDALASKRANGMGNGNVRQGSPKSRAAVRNPGSTGRLYGSDPRRAYRSTAFLSMK